MLNQFNMKNQGHDYASEEFKEFQLALISNLSEKKRQEYEEWKSKVMRFVELEDLHKEIWQGIEGENPACSWEEFNRLENV